VMARRLGVAGESWVASQPQHELRSRGVASLVAVTQRLLVKTVTKQRLVKTTRDWDVVCAILIC
jgi:hypothetical protein